MPYAVRSKLDGTYFVINGPLTITPSLSAALAHTVQWPHSREVVEVFWVIKSANPALEPDNYYNYGTDWYGQKQYRTKYDSPSQARARQRMEKPGFKAKVVRVVRRVR